MRKYWDQIFGLVSTSTAKDTFVLFTGNVFSAFCVFPVYGPLVGVNVITVRAVLTPYIVLGEAEAGAYPYIVKCWDVEA